MFKRDHNRNVHFLILTLVVCFDSNGKANIRRLQETPKELARAPLQFSGIEGHWKIVDYTKHPECIGCEFEISSQNTNQYHLHTRVINSLNSTLEHNPTNNTCTASPIMSTMMAGPPEEMHKEHLISNFISKIQSLELQGQQHLVIQTTDGQQTRLERFAPPSPSPVTENIFNGN